MKKFLSFVFLSGIIVTSGAYAESGVRGSVSDEHELQKHRQGRVPRAFRGDEVLAPLLKQLRESRVAMRPQIKSLREQFAEANDEGKTAIKESLRELMRSNRDAQREVRRAIKIRIRELRAARNT